jgi:hypothetical protein
MDINFNGNSIGNFGFGRIDSGAAQGTAPATVNQKALDKASFNVKSSTVDTLQGSEPVTDVPAAELTRDDDLGKLMKAVFNLPPPPMPAFGE